jgi:AraC-like DNA-binding protein
MLALNICLAVNLIILFFAFFFRKNNSLPNKILALLLLDTAISFLGNATIVGGYFADFPCLFFLSWCTSTFFGPLFFSYTCLFTGSHLNLKHPVWLGAFCTSMFGLSFPATYIMLPLSERAGFALSLLREPLPWQMTVINIGAMLIIWISLFSAAIKVVSYKKRLINTVSNLEKTKLAFITQFVALGFLLTFISTVAYLVLPQYRVEYLYLPCFLTLFYLFIFIYTFRYHAIFTTESYGQFLQDTLSASEEQFSSAIKPDTAQPRELQGLAQRIEEYLVKSEIYTNPDLTISALANGMKISTEKVSSAINKEMNKNFFDLINEKRVEKAKQLLSDKITQMTIEAIGYEAGFNSRASFYRAFKKSTSLTPSEYLSQTPSATLRANP